MMRPKMRQICMRNAIAVAAAAGLAFSAAAQAPSELDSLSGRSAEPLDELDALSQTTDDPFAGMASDAARRPVSVTLRALNKITARFTDIEAPIGESVRFSSLEILPRFCDKRPPEEFPETTAFLEVFDRDLARARSGALVEARDISRRPPREGEEMVEKIDQPTDELPATSAGLFAPAATALDPDRIFSGWMFGSSPGLNALEHPIYDVWVIDCKTERAEE